jgi:type IV secretory pathway protease TraF
LIDPSPETSAAGDVVSIRPLGPGEPTRGDLVAVRWQGGLHVKRVVGLPGDTISLDALRLRIDDQRIEDLLAASGRELPSLLVDSDAHRPRSRWAPRGDDGGWTRTPQRIWQSIAENPAWLVYEHRSVYRHPQPGPVLDDYPFNVTLARKLFGVERLLVRARVDAEPQTEVEVAFWSAAGIRRARVRPADRSELAVGWYDAEPCDAENSEGQPPVTANDPLAIRIRGGPITLAKLTIERFVEYRLRPHDDRAAYPLRLGEGECFVLGDNVPVSVDSRNIGPVPLVSIAGVVVRVDRSPLKALKADPGVSKHGAVSGLPRF